MARVSKYPDELREVVSHKRCKRSGCRFPPRPGSLRKGTHVRVEEDIACPAVAGRD